ncbi:enoyl-CoA hydratase/isomerase family protein [Chachezhania antarctica]|uniref:enoyl-CoA hydratase/isomerase family protein n=1 Tax=Chachezhania antarctica TaxID=2340860 RepID=UPI000EB5B6C2|nr:enoyl-CoA hydratase-related protein [Chachezhania antarctica]|tara:strand:+ start:6688 stop:7476 length:789 start_codon:yes stop_codon:yes gene_type:complete
MSYKTLDLAIADGIARITLNRPDQANALDRTMAQELFAASLAVSTDPSVRAVLLTGRGKLFCGGGDLAAMDAAGDGREAMLLEMATLLHQAIIRFNSMDAPMVVAVNGAAGGAGFSILLAGDYVIAADTAKFVSGYTASGLTPDGSSTHFLAKHVGLLRAKELMLTNRPLSAREACEWGLVSRVVPHESLGEEAEAMARQFADGPTKAFGGVKRLLQTTYSDSIEAQLEKESVSIAKMVTTEDGPHGIRSFLNKVKPVFKGR